MRERTRAGVGGLEFTRSHSDLVDSVVQGMFAIACQQGGGRDVGAVPIAVVATGGYGRQELCSHSDIDITFIPHRDGDAAVDRVIKEMFALVMRVFIDACGMEVGYAYRLIDDAPQLDHQTTSGLLDARLVAGSQRVFVQFENEFWACFNPADFIFTKLAERRAQRGKAGATPRVVEPDLKDGAGGLRDIQAAVWVTQASRCLTAARVRGPRSFDILERYANVSPEEVARLTAAKEFIFRVRNALHAAADAERDELVVTRQEEVADALGYGRLAGDLAVTRSAERQAPPPVERMMRDLYGHTTAVHRICDQVMRRIEDGRIFLGIGLDCKRRQVEPANEALTADDPLWMLWACEVAQRYGLAFSDGFERAATSLVSTAPAIRDSAQAAEILTHILASPRGTYRVLQRMAELGILGWVLPEVAAILDLIPYDPSHDYTVGQHSLHVIRTLDLLRDNAPTDETRDLRQILKELAAPEQLYLAGLLHDCGKGDPERPHQEAGEAIAQAVCERLGWSTQATENVRFLVRHHLLMAETSRLRDTNLDETIRDFTAVVGDLERLQMLYLLTYADTSAVGAGVWTQVKGRFLRDLYRRAERALAGDESEEYDDPGLARARRRLLRELSVENLPQEEVVAHVESMPAPYILNTSLSEMALHIGYVRQVRSGEPVVVFRDERDATYTEVTICTFDDPEPGLLAKIAGVLHASDIEVHSAQVFTRVGEQERIAIDTLTVDYRGRQLTPGKRKEVATSLRAVLQGAVSVAEVLEKRRKSAAIGGPVEQLAVRNDLSEVYTVVEVESADSGAMLYRTSGALSAVAWDIHSARLSLFRGRFIGCFYVLGVRHLPAEAARGALLDLMPVVSS
ncbi:MAG TPA: HD domain-containing protein [Chthonomonadales bacterium]|nr:HD domain-containing protein [Chthonomonadales bacterium]